MGRGLVVLAALLSLSSCAAAGGVGGAAPSARPAGVGTPAPAEMSALVPFFGSYGTDDGDVLVIARLGWFFDERDSDYRTIYSGPTPTHFTIGPGFLVPLPKVADLVFTSDTLTLTASGRARVAHRIAYRQTEVTIPADGAQLAGTVTEPLGPGPHPGIVIIHGSEPGQRFFYDIWVGVYARLGLTVLTYDKRGNGASTGQYPGEYPSAEALQTYADDAGSALRFIAGWPGVDPKRVGFHGGSQGGWTVPLAIQRQGRAAFALVLSAPATTTGQTDLWKDFSGGGQRLPTLPVDEMNAAVRANNSGYDPRPALQVLTVPTLWFLGRNDRTVPTAVCVEILGSLHRPNITLHLLPTGHALLLNATGLTADDERSPGLAPDLLPAMAAWLKPVLSA